MHHIGRLHFQGQVESLRVIDLHYLSHHIPGLSQISWATKQEFAVEYPVDPLRQRVLITGVAVGHGAGQAILCVDIMVVVEAILDTPIRMMDQTLPHFFCDFRAIPGACAVCSVCSVSFTLQLTILCDQTSVTRLR